MAKGNKRKFGSFRYPMARLEDDSDYLEIKVVEYQPPGFNASETQSLRLQTSSESLKNFTKHSETRLILSRKQFQLTFGAYDLNLVTRHFKTWIIKFWALKI